MSIPDPGLPSGRQGQLRDQLGRVPGITKQLTEVVARLEQRLSPLLGTEPPTPASGTKASPEDTLVPMACEVRQFLNIVQHQIDCLEMLLDLLEL